MPRDSPMGVPFACAQCTHRGPVGSRVWSYAPRAALPTAPTAPPTAPTAGPTLH